MFIRMRESRAQSILEYAVLITTIMAALVVMRGYLKRSMQGKVKGTADDLGHQWSADGQIDSKQATYSISAEKSTPGGADGDAKSGQASYSHSSADAQEWSESPLANDSGPNKLDPSANLDSGNGK
jgi:hypothetical protein